MNIIEILQVLVLLAFANMTPVVAKKIFRDFGATPLDGGLSLADGHRLFGSSKTIRGAAGSLLASSIGAPLVGLPWHVGALVAVSAVVGDLLTSFCKRRMGLAPSHRTIGLDQVPESLIPALTSTFVLPLTLLDVATITIVFSAAALALQFGLGLPHEGADSSTPKSQS
jgi:CDP-2,3-bis-(O-geranylgeranyl)-sn-glycerol synthase